MVIETMLYDTWFGCIIKRCQCYPRYQCISTILIFYRSNLMKNTNVGLNQLELEQSAFPPSKIPRDIKKIQVCLEKYSGPCSNSQDKFNLNTKMN